MGKPYHSDPIATPPEQDRDLGRQLRNAREASRLSITSVASSLHLAPRIIEALEGNDFNQFEPVYVRGYLRNYARLLELSPDPLISIYNQTLPPEHPPVQAHIPKTDLPTPARSGGYWLAAVIALPLLLWGVGRVFHSEGDAALPKESPAPLAAGPAAVEEPHANLLLPGQIAVAASKQTPEPQPAAVPSQPSPTPVTPSPPPLAKLAPPVAEPASPAPVAMPAATTPNPPPVQAGQTAGEGPDSIAIQLSASGWVSIRDKAGRRLVYESLPAGAERTVKGQAPFAVVLGNWPATKITLNGQATEPAKPKAGTVARFSLGQPATAGSPAKP